MKTLIFIILTTLSFTAFAQNPKPTRPYRVIRTLIADLNNDHHPDTIRLLSPFDDWNSFNKISITLTGYGKTTLKARDYWTVVDSDFLITNKNAIHTKLLFLKSTPVHSVILLFSELSPAGYRGEFSIINIENNKVKLVFDTTGEENEPDIEVPLELTDLAHDGRLCFAYTGLHELITQVTLGKKKGFLGSYTPYLVYRVDDSCKMNKPLSKAYMEQHYAFGGYRYSEKIEVFYPDDHSQPRLWKGKTQK